MSELNTPEIPDTHFDGGRNLTRNETAGDTGSLTEILQAARQDLLLGQLDTPEAYSKQSIMIDNEGAAASADVDILIPEGAQIRVLDVSVIMRGNGSASDTVQVKKVATGPTVNNISDAIDISDASGSGKTKKSTTLDPAHWELDGDDGDILRVSLVDGGGTDRPAVTVVVDFAII